MKGNNMKYCVAEIYFEEGKPYVQFRAKNNHMFYWTSDINNQDIVWGSEEGAKRFCRLKAGRTIIPENWTDKPDTF